MDYYDMNACMAGHKLVMVIYVKSIDKYFFSWICMKEACVERRDKLENWQIAIDDKQIKVQQLCY